jgi:ribosome-binding factor A
MSVKEVKLKELIRTLAAEYFSRQSNRQSLITVTGAEIESKGERAVILVTVMPEEEEKAALGFVHRQLSGFREYVMERARMRRIPYFDVKIDKGEKNRQRLDEIARTI